MITPRTHVEIVEVSPRDGIQNEDKILDIHQKLELVAQAVAFGARRIEVGSFVNPGKVPQMAATPELLAALPETSDVVYIGLVLNLRGAERALDTKVHELGAVCVASDTFAMRNQGQTWAGSVKVAREIITMGQEAGRRAQATIAGAFGCQFEGPVPVERVLDIARELADAGTNEIALADTIGVAVPRQVSALVELVREAVPGIALRGHFHNTRNTGLANVWAAVVAGVATIDASLGGAGGCPFAPGAAGNVPTEDVQYLLEQSGVSTDLDLDRLIDASRWFARVMGRQLPAMVSRAGGFPAPHPPSE